MPGGGVPATRSRVATRVARRLRGVKGAHETPHNSATAIVEVVADLP